MVAFRRCIIAFAVLALFAGLAAAQGTGGQTPLTCSTNVTATPQLRSEGYTENTGDITITCTGGPTLAAGSVIPAVNITIFLNTQVTSRLLNGTTDNRSEALLLIDEPGSPTISPAATGFGPAAGQNLCTTPLTGCTEFVGTAAAIPPATGTVEVALDAAGATTNGKNVFQGIVQGNSVTWFGVPVLPPATTGITRTFRFTNIRANTSALSGSSAAGTTPVIASIAVSNTAALPITNPTPTVGFVQSGLTATVSSSLASLQQCTTTTRSFVSTLAFTENFGTAFKTRIVPPAGGGANSAQGIPVGPTGLSTQNIPGSIYNSESNFVLPTAVGTNGAIAGLADWGTRLKATFNNVPTGVRLFVSVNNVLNGNSGLAPVPTTVGGPDTTTSYAQAITSETAAENSSAGGFPLATSFSSTAKATNGDSIPITELSVVNGTATAVWEVVNTNPSKTETFYFAVYTTFASNVTQNTPPAGTGSVNLSFAPTPPVFTAASAAVASPTLGVPRFIQDPNAAKNIFSLGICRTILLYPFVTNAAGFDTGLAIANTSTDPFGTGVQAGTCSLNWFSGTNSPPVTNTGNIATGTVYTALASATLPANFTGYMIAVCNFQYAHGFAFISDLGARNLAMGYLALVVPDPGTGTRGASPNAIGGGGTGEGLAN